MREAQNKTDSSTRHISEKYKRITMISGEQDVLGEKETMASEDVI